MSIPPVLPQQQREHPEPHERSRPVPWPMLWLVALLVAFGVAYIALTDLSAPSAWGDGRQANELRAGAKAPSATTAVDGAAVYAARCAACHQANGAGVPGVFPPLAGSEWVLGSPKTLAALVLHGLTGPITVKGQSYSGAMPAFGAQLSDAEIAAVLSHVRTQWGASISPASAVDAALVAQVRQATAERKTPFNGEAELKALP